MHGCDAQLSFVTCMPSRQLTPPNVINNWRTGMPSLLKSTVFGLGLLAGVAATAYAQSVSSLPPTGGATAPTTPPAVPSSTQSVFPKPGGQSLFQEDHYQATEQDNTPARHPYTSTGTGPRPN